MKLTTKFRAWDGKKMFAPFTLIQGLNACAESVHALGMYDEKTIFLQYTGLKDWHKTEIYIGYIVQFTEKPSPGFPNGYKFRAVVENMWDMRDHCWEKGVDYEDITVVGNIYEHPHLMER